MDGLVSSRLSLVLLAAAAVMVCACEPISLSNMTGGSHGEEDGGHHLDEEGDGGSDGGGDGGSEDIPPLGPDGVDRRMTAWGPCIGGWQSRTALALGTLANPDFGLDADGEAYFVEYGADLARVVTTKPWKKMARIPWMGMYPWIGGVRVDAEGDVHVALSPQFDNETGSVPTYFYENKQGQWTSNRLSGAWIQDFDMDSQGNLHALVMLPVGSFPLRHVHGPPGTPLVNDEPFVVLQNRDRMHSMRVDAQGHAHVVYEYTAIPRMSVLNYATNASGAWVTEQVTSSGRFAQIAVSSEGVPYIMWGDGAAVFLAVRRGKNDWVTTQAGPELGLLGAMLVTGSGTVHMLQESGTNLNYWVRSERGWEKTTLLQAEKTPFGNPFGASHLEVDKQGHVHAMYAVYVEGLVNGSPGMLKRIDYSRQCQ
ncbi:hypothetical protein [Myxococcus stipitatus]|uniref:hypothetical protein n=1 Tax=Myxococcus stipitatus TaxID=83455 RepID=UPI0030D03293